MSATTEQDINFAADQPEFVAWLKREHDLEFRQGLKPRVAWICRLYRAEFESAKAAARDLIDVEFAR
jgi:hypothetical protein